MLLSLIAAAWADPNLIPVQGALTDDVGAPISGVHTLRFGLATSAGGAPAWGAPITVTLTGGAFAALVDVTAQNLAGDLWLSVEVDGGAPSSPISVGWSPRARYAAEAGVAEWALTAASADHATEADAADWALEATSAESALSADEADVALTALLADEATTLGGHGALEFVLGADLAGEIASALAAGLSGNAKVNGWLQVGQDASSNPCSNATHYGRLRFDGTNFQGCTASGWKTLSAAADGSASGSAARTCRAIKSTNSAATSGTYWIDPLQNGSPFQAYCDMTTDGGGWTFVGAWGNMSGYDMYSFTANGRLTTEVMTAYTTTRAAGTGTGQGPAHYSSAVINALFHNGAMEYLSVVGRSGTAGGILTKHKKTSADANYDAYKGIYRTQYMTGNGFSAWTHDFTVNANPLPVASPSWVSRSVTGRACAEPTAGINCYHYLPDDITGGGQWLFRENSDNTPYGSSPAEASYNGSSAVPSLLFIR